MANTLRIAFEIGSPRDIAAELTMLASGYPESHCGCRWDGLPEDTLFTSLFESGPSFQAGLNLRDVTKWFIVDTGLSVTAVDIARAEQMVKAGWTYALPAAIASGFEKRLLDLIKRFCSQIVKEFAQSLEGGLLKFPGHISFNPGELAMQATGKVMAPASQYDVDARWDTVNNRLTQAIANNILTPATAQDITDAALGEKDGE